MEHKLRKIYQKRQLIFRVLLIAIASALVVYFFPKRVAFSYDFQKGKPWLYESLYAPFDITVHRADEDTKNVNSESIVNTSHPLFNFDTEVKTKVKTEFKKLYKSLLSQIQSPEKEYILGRGLRFIDSIYSTGVLRSSPNIKYDNIDLIYGDNRVKNVNVKDLFLTKDLELTVYIFFQSQYDEQLYKLFLEIITPNIHENKTITQNTVNEAQEKITPAKRVIDKGTQIILKGEIVKGDSYEILISLREEFLSKTQNKSDKTWLFVGYSIIVSITVTLLLLYIRRYYNSVYQDDYKLVLIFFNMIAMVAMVNFAMRYGSDYIYAVPLSILPLTLNPFFGNRLTFITHIITLLLLGFIVPGSFDFLFIQFVVALVIVLTDFKIYRRSQLFSGIGQIVLVYFVVFVALNIIREGSNFLMAFRWKISYLFLINGIATLFVQPLVYVYEKVFSLVSDVSLLELSDANSKLLRVLSEKAPGTFQHSLQVANLAEAAANKIGAATLLVRVGALYHDIGKMKNPLFFTENQMSVMSPHEDLTPQESAKVIIGHVREGIEIAKKHKLPDRVIDFIRTHHGTSLVRYFYMMAKEKYSDVDIKDFRYTGPIPFSKETAIVMMADVVEASSKSIKNPTQSTIDQFVDKVIALQVDENQFMNANITFKEVEDVKKVFKKKLTNIYNLRIEYPD